MTREGSMDLEFEARTFLGERMVPGIYHAEKCRYRGPLDGIRFAPSAFEATSSAPGKGRWHDLGRLDGKGPGISEIPLFMSTTAVLGMPEEARLGISVGCSMTSLPLPIAGKMLPRERELVVSGDSTYISPILPDRKGFDLQTLKGALFVELMMTDINSMTCPDGAFSPGIGGRFPEVADQKDLKDLVSMVKEALSVPVVVTMNAGFASRDLDRALVTDADAVNLVVGPLEGVAASSNMEGFCPGIVPALVEAKERFDTFKARERGKRLFVSAPVMNGLDALKLRCLGADAVSMAPVIGSFVQWYLRWKEGGKGSEAENTDILEKVGNDRFDWAEIGEMTANLILSMRKEYQAGLAALGLSSSDDLGRELLRAADYDTAAVSGLPLEGFGKQLPMWMH